MQEENRECSTIHSTTGGVMTREVGAVTGELEICTRLVAEGLEVAARYAGADEWYAAAGSPVELGDDGGCLFPLELRELHEQVVGHLTTPGLTVDGNEEPVSLLAFSP